MNSESSKQTATGLADLVERLTEQTRRYETVVLHADEWNRVRAAVQRQERGTPPKPSSDGDGKHRNPS